MRERSEHGAARPLPRDWLPDAHPPEGAAVWDVRTRRIMAATGPELQKLSSRHSATEASWWSVMALWWKSAAALATVSIALLLAVARRTVFPEPPPASIPLGLVVSDGDPATLWQALGIQADPVLAHIAVRERVDVTPAGPTTVREEENR